ncbi:MAG TPA: hypothetical protein EYQ84_10610 [Nitrospinaceae bacterium]|nr:hypothetical protein [Nitrospinaceae bacterium]
MHRPYLKEQCEDLCEYVAAWSGGVDARYLDELDAWSKSLPVRREINAKQLQLLAKAQIAWAPEWPTACFKALLAAPKQFITRDEASMFNKGDIDNMGGKCPKTSALLKEAVCIMRDCRGWVTSMGLVGVKVKMFISAMDITLVHAIHKKECKERPKYEKLVDIGRKFVADVSAYDPAATAASTLPYKPTTPATAASVSAARGGVAMREYKDGELTVKEAVKLGFKVDVWLTNKVSKVSFVITEAAGRERETGHRFQCR